MDFLVFTRILVRDQFPVWFHFDACRVAYANDNGNTVRLFVIYRGEYTFTMYSVSQGDADGDGIENDLDTCPFDVNEGDPRVAGDGDPDNDGLDSACDPEPEVANTDADDDADHLVGAQLATSF